MSTGDSLLALVEAEKDATPGPWACEVTEVNDLHAGSVTMPMLAGPDTYGPSLADTRLIAASRNLAPALAGFVLSLSPEDEGMVEGLVNVVINSDLDALESQHEEVGADAHRRRIRSVLSALRDWADEKIGEAG